MPVNLMPQISIAVRKHKDKSVKHTDVLGDMFLALQNCDLNFFLKEPKNTEKKLLFIIVSEVYSLVVL